MLLNFFFLLLKESFAGTTKDRSVIHSLPTSEYAIYAMVSLLLVLIGGLMSGLTVGLMGIDELALELKIASGTPEEKKDALKVLKIINDHHLLLVTLLLANAFAMEALPLCLDAIFNTEISLFLSVTFVLAFGEVIPQSLCTGSNQIKIACRCVPIVSIFIIVLFPLSYPIARLLDKLFGLKEVKRKLGENELRTFIGIQKSESYDHSGLDNFQVQMMFHTMDLDRQSIHDLIIPLDQLPMVNIESEINLELISSICKLDCDFVTVFKETKEKICGSFRVQKIFAAIKEMELLIKNIELDDICTFNMGKSLLDCLKQLEAYNSEIIYISNANNEIIGIIKKQDILNRILMSTQINERSRISDISLALIKVLENREKRNSYKTEILIKERDRVLST